MQDDVERIRDAISEVIWPLADWDGERCVADSAAEAAAQAALAAMQPRMEAYRDALERIVAADTHTEHTPHLDYANDREVWSKREVLGQCAKIARAVLEAHTKERG